MLPSSRGADVFGGPGDRWETRSVTEPPAAAQEEPGRSASQVIRALAPSIYVPTLLQFIGQAALMPVVTLLALRLGFSEAQAARLREAGQVVPLLVGANMSRSVIAMYDLVRTAARLLGDEFDIEIFDFHPWDKIDAPSGTALELAAHAAEGKPEETERTALAALTALTGVIVASVVAIVIIVVRTKAKSVRTHAPTVPGNDPREYLKAPLYWQLRAQRTDTDKIHQVSSRQTARM